MTDTLALDRLRSIGFRISVCACGIWMLLLLSDWLMGGGSSKLRRSAFNIIRAVMASWSLDLLSTRPGDACNEFSRGD